MFGNDDGGRPDAVRTVRSCPARATHAPAHRAVGDTRRMAQGDATDADARPRRSRRGRLRPRPPTPTLPHDSRTDPGRARDPPRRPGRRRTARPSAHRRRPGLWLPLVVFVALLVAGGGRRPVRRAPARARSGRGADGAGGRRPAHAPADAAPGDGLPPLPTPPARPADALADWAGRVAAAIGVPAVAIQAYGYAQLVMQDSDPRASSAGPRWPASARSSPSTARPAGPCWARAGAPTP